MGSSGLSGGGRRVEDWRVEDWRVENGGWRMAVEAQGRRLEGEEAEEGEGGGWRVKGARLECWRDGAGTATVWSISNHGQAGYEHGYGSCCSVPLPGADLLLAPAKIPQNCQIWQFQRLIRQQDRCMPPQSCLK